MATVEQLTIQFEGKGAPKLTAQLNSLSTAMNRLAGRQIEATRATRGASKATDSYNDRMTKNGRNVNALTGAFGRFGKKMSQMRSQLLIVAFAVGIVTKTIQGLINSYKEFGQVTGRIDAVVKSTGAAAGKTTSQLIEMSNQFQETFAVANTSILEVTSRILTFTNIVGDSIERVTETALNLSAVFGTDLNQATIQVAKAINDPIKGYTALRRVGISFSQTQIDMIKNFQEQGDVISAQNVIFEELERELGGAAKKQLEASYASTELTKSMNSLSDTARELGNLLQPVVAGVSSMVNIISDGIGFVLKAPRELGEHLGLIVKHFTSFRDLLFQSGSDIKILEELSFQLATASTNIANMQDKFFKLNGEFETLAETSKAFTPFDVLGDMRKSAAALVSEGNIEKGRVEFEKYMQAILNNNFVIDKFLRAQNDLSGRAKKLSKEFQLYISELKVSHGVTNLNGTVTEKLNLILLKREEITRLVNAGLMEIIDAQIINNELVRNEIDLEEIRKQKKQQTSLAIINSMQSISAAHIQEQQNQLNADKQTQLTAANSIRSERKRAKAISKINEEFADKQKALNEKSRQSKRTQTVINTATAVMEVFADKELGGFAKAAMYGLVTMLGAQQLKTIDAAVYEKGGLIGGRRHSQGGTIIEAEQGEYVVSRAGVDSIGVEALNRINAGGGGGVSISINNPILSKDVVEDDLIPQIKEAIRRGADIGVS